MQRTPIALALAAGLAMTSAHAEDASLRQELEALRAEVGALKAQVAQLRGAQSAVPVAAPATAAVAAVPAGAQPIGVPARTSVAAAETESTRLWGYGELNYVHPTGNGADAQADVRRAVIGFSHAFSESTHVYGELEWEHAIVSADDAGESEVEQLYVEHQVNPAFAVRAGLSLIPLGFINERHEPVNYYGVERNFVETAIIPSTWREGGVSALGTTEGGLSWNVGVTTGFDLAKWDATSEEGRTSPLASIHQELQLAKAHDASVYASVNWQGVPAADTERVWTVGLNYYLTPQVVFKADYQHFNISDLVLGYGNRFDLGVGYQF